MKNVDILYEDKDIIVCIKEPGIPVQSDKTRDRDMVNILRNYVIESEYGYIREKGIPFIGLVHRLDRPVGGVMVFAKNQNSLKKLNIQLNNGQFSKSYYALTEEKVEMSEEWIRLENYLLKDGRTNTSKVVDSNIEGAKKAILEYRLVETCDNISMIEINLLTGRHHQIRVQMANKGMPLLGDCKYNNTKVNNITKADELRRTGSIKGNIGKEYVALYSYKLEFIHPTSGKPMRFESTPKKGMFKLFTQ